MLQYPQDLERTLGDIKGRIMGQFAKGPTPPGTPAKMSLKAAIPVLPFILKGAFNGKAKPSPFTKDDGATPIAPIRILGAAEREQLHQRWVAVKSYR
jgi:hypothetical protein